MMDLKRIPILEQEIEDFHEKIMELEFTLNKQKGEELHEFLKTLYWEVCQELEDEESKLTKEQILTNIKKYLEDFSQNYKINI